MILRKIITIILPLLLWGSFLFAQTNEKPKLILQITVDQLRGDLPTKYMKSMGDGGFNLSFYREIQRGFKYSI